MWFDKPSDAGVHAALEAALAENRRLQQQIEKHERDEGFLRLLQTQTTYKPAVAEVALPPSVVPALHALVQAMHKAQQRPVTKPGLAA